VRQLYTDQDEVLFDAARPVILNGIEDIVERPDLADRALFLTLEAIPEKRRRPEAELWVGFETERPRILGALLDAVVEGLKRLPEARLPGLPRMADFALWATACETVLWPSGTFWSAYNSNRDETVEGVIDADPVAAAVRAFMSERTEWTGTASDLLDNLTDRAGERISKSKEWPSSPRSLSGHLRRAATFLRKIGIEVAFKKEGRARTRIIHIAAFSLENAAPQPSIPSARSEPSPKAAPVIDFPAKPVRPVASNVGDSDTTTIRTNPLETRPGSAADGADAKSRSHSEAKGTGTLGWRVRI